MARRYLVDGGRLQFDLAIADGVIVGAALVSTRPAAARLLVGKTPAQALALVPLLFSLCGKAQRAVAAAALAAAVGEAAGRGKVERRPVRIEALQETVWRLLLDWPEALGCGRRDAAFANLHRRLATATAADTDAIEQLLAAEIYGVEPQAWRAGTRPAAALATRLLAAAEALPATAIRATASPLLPPLCAAAAAGLLGGGGSDFHRAPVFDDQPAETGALARHAAEPSVAARLAAGDPLAARLEARLLDLCALREVLAAAPEAVAAHAPEAGVGVAVTDTARGQLIHRVRVAAGRIADYVVVAPTEWNFHPQGGWRAELLGRRVVDRDAAIAQARSLILSLDPCVAYEITVDGHPHA